MARFDAACEAKPGNAEEALPGRIAPVPSPRLERGAYGLGNRRSIHLSYEG